MTRSSDQCTTHVNDGADQVARASRELERRIRGYEGVYDIRNSYERGRPEVKLNIKPEAEALGLTLAGQGRDLVGQPAHPFPHPAAVDLEPGLARFLADTGCDDDYFTTLKILIITGKNLQRIGEGNGMSDIIRLRLRASLLCSVFLAARVQLPEPLFLELAIAFGLFALTADFIQLLLLPQAFVLQLALAFQAQLLEPVLGLALALDFEFALAARGFLLGLAFLLGFTLALALQFGRALLPSIFQFLGAPRLVPLPLDLAGIDNHRLDGDRHPLGLAERLPVHRADDDQREHQHMHRDGARHRAGHGEDFPPRHHD